MSLMRDAFTRWDRRDGHYVWLSRFDIGPLVW